MERVSDCWSLDGLLSGCNWTVCTPMFAQEARWGKNEAGSNYNENRWDIVQLPVSYKNADDN